MLNGHRFSFVIFVLQDGGRTVLLDKEEIQRVVSSCNDFAEAEKRSKQLFVTHPKCLLIVIASQLKISHRQASHSIDVESTHLTLQ